MEKLGRCQLAGTVAQKGHAVGQRRRIQAGHGTAIAAGVPRHEHGVHALAREVVQARVGQLGGKAHAFGGDGADALACRAGRFRTPVVGHAEGEAQRGEQGVPERALLVGGQHAGQADAGAAPPSARQDVAETCEQLLLERDRVRRAAFRRLRRTCRRHVGARSVVPRARVGAQSARAHRTGAGLLLQGAFDARLCPVATVAADEAPPGGELHDGERADVLAAGAAHCRAPWVERGQFLRADERAFRSVPLFAQGVRPQARRECRADGSHEVRRVGPHGFDAAHQLERAQHRVGHEGAALYHHVRPQGVQLAHADDAEQRVLHHGIGDAGRDVLRFHADLLRMAHARRHEHGAFRAQVHRLPRFQRRGGEPIGRGAQRVCGAFDERAAAARTRLVEHGVRHASVADPDGLHVLAPDVEEEGKVGLELLRRAHVRERFHHSGIDA